MGIITDLLSNNKTKVEEAKAEIQRVYISDDRPWVVGYSGGKDSTAVIQLVFDALKELDSQLLTKKIYVISSDTLVETPLIIQSINTTLRRIEDKANEIGLPIETHKVRPLVEESFWLNIIGKGYPSPNQQFRWCTDRLKIDPANRFILDKVDTFGEVIMVLGVRESESATRASTIQSHTIEGRLLMRHSTLNNAYVYAPIKSFVLDDVWNYLLSEPSPWGDDNHELYRLYSESNSGDCPLIVDKTVKESAGSCGNSRFGCWTCTVVHEDKALTGFIRNGQDWMKPLLAFRNWLAGIRDDRTMRMKYRMNGQIYFSKLNTIKKDDEEHIVIPRKGHRVRSTIAVSSFDKIVHKDELRKYIDEHNIDLSSSEDPNILITDDNGEYYQLGLGPFTLEARKEILERLLRVQKNIENPYDDSYKLIQEEELKEIRRVWFSHGDLEDSLPGIFRKVFGYDLDWQKDNKLNFDEEELAQLELLCQEEEIDFALMKKLLIIQREYVGLRIKRGLSEKITSALTQEYLHI